MSSSSSSSSREEEEEFVPLISTRALPTPQMKDLLEVRANVTTAVLHNVDHTVANVMRAMMLSYLPVIGVVSEPYAVTQLKISANTNAASEHNETIGVRISCIPVESLSAALVNDYDLVLDVNNDEGTAPRLVTSADFTLERRADADAAAADDDAADAAAPAPPLDAPEARRVFPPTRGRYTAIAVLRPPATFAGDAIQLRARFKWVRGTGPFAPCIVGFGWLQDKRAAKRRWEEIEAPKVEAVFNARVPAAAAGDDRRSQALARRLAEAKHDYAHDGARRCTVPGHFFFTYEAINRAYPFAVAWRAAANLVCAKLADIQRAADDGTLEVLPFGEARARGYSSAVSTQIIGEGVGFDVILPGVRGALGHALAYALFLLCFDHRAAARAPQAGDGDGDGDEQQQQEQQDDDDDEQGRLLFCAFVHYSDQDDFGVMRLAVASDSPELIFAHMHTACDALRKHMTAVGKL